jgi:hypothetical protein
VNPTPETRLTMRAPGVYQPHPTLTRVHRLIVWTLGCLLAGCAIVGPPSIRNGRSLYNDAINDTNNQQLLMVVIRERYSENSSLMNVSSVTANVSVSTSAGIQFGFGNESNYRGNLVPFSTGAIYEENPTVSYTPVEGQKYLRQVISPVPLSILIPLCEAVASPGMLLTALLSRVNDLSNPSFLTTPVTPDARFTRFVELVSLLGRAEVLNWVKDSERSGRFSAVIHHFRPGYEAETRELLHLLGLPGPAAAASEIVIPVSRAIGQGNREGITFSTRSVYDLLEMLSAAVDVPGEDAETGAAISYPRASPLGRQLRILRSRDEPEDAYVAVKHRGWWYYIDNTDQPTKRFFHLVTVLWSVTLAESTARGQKAPVLMLPASH